MFNPSAVPGDHDASLEAKTPLRATCSTDIYEPLPPVDASTMTTGMEGLFIGTAQPVEPRRRLHLVQSVQHADRPGTSRLAEVDRSGLIRPKSRRITDKRPAHRAALRYALLATTRQAT